MEKSQIATQDIETPKPLVEVEVPEISNPESLQKIFRKSVPEFSDTTDFHRGSRSGGVGHQLVAWSFVAAFIDALILFSIACFFLLSFSLLVKAQANLVLDFFGGSFYQFGLFVGASLVCTYMIMLRIFLGYTIGEWACRLRLGSLKQRLHRFYSLKVIARMILIFSTGLFVIPFLSLIFGKDLAGRMVGLPLVLQPSQRQN